MLVLLSMYTNRMAFSFYCLGTLDLMGVADTKISEVERKDWAEWIWAQQARAYPLPLNVQRHPTVTYAYDMFSVSCE